jgi:filamentous hemagglutinin
MSFFTTPQGRTLTEHARESLLRHGFREPFALIDYIIDNPTHFVIQADGSRVYIQRVSERKRSYNLVIEGEEGIVTGMRNKTPQELKNLARNYGWELW